MFPDLLHRHCQLTLSLVFCQKHIVACTGCLLMLTVPHVSQAEILWKMADEEVQACQLNAEQDKADILAKQLQVCREEGAGLRSRVYQLQQIKHARDSAAALACLACARAAAVPPNLAIDRQALQQRHRCHANACPPPAKT